MVRGALGLGVVAALGVMVACSYADCALGVWPFDGATGVDPEGPFLVVTPGAWDPEVVALAGVVRLQSPAGRAVETTITRLDASTLEVWPVDPLPPGRYTLEAMEYEALEEGTSGHYVAAGFGPVRQGRVAFEVGGSPRALHWFPDEATADRAALVFSDAIDPATLVDRVWLAGEPVDLVPIGVDGRVFGFLLPPDGTEPGDLEVLEGVRTRLGLPVPEGTVGQGQDVIERVTGAPWCRP